MVLCGYHVNHGAHLLIQVKIFTLQVRAFEVL